MEINYVCSLGSLCHSAQILKRNNLKTCSYPFDWIFSNYNIILHCIADDFKIFLDKSYYIDRTISQCGHRYYSPYLFNHHNPLVNENDYKYFVRCVNRFKNLLQTSDHKLFTMIFINCNTMNENNSMDERFKNMIVEFNKQFSKYTKNYTLLVILHIQYNHHISHSFTYKDNIHFLELHTLSYSDGIKFIDDNDNNYLDNIIMTKYKFNLHP